MAKFFDWNGMMKIKIISVYKCNKSTDTQGSNNMRLSVVSGINKDSAASGVTGGRERCVRCQNYQPRVCEGA